MFDKLEAVDCVSTTDRVHVLGEVLEVPELLSQVQALDIVDDV